MNSYPRRNKLNQNYRARPMSEAQYQVFHEQTAIEYGIESKIQSVAEKGGSLAVKSLVTPNFSVSPEQFLEEVSNRRANPDKV